jgi:coenzyme F420 hydrogenase subunit beta
MPGFLRPLVGWLMPRIGPRGLEFARARAEMKAVETVLHLRSVAPRRLRSMVPAHVWQLVASYGLSRSGITNPRAGEASRAPTMPQSVSGSSIKPPIL